MELLLTILVGIAEVTFEVDGDFENLTVGFVVGFTGETIDLIGELLALIGSVLDLKIGFTFKGVFHADSDAIGDSSVRFSVIFGVLEGLLDNFDNFG